MPKPKKGEVLSTKQKVFVAEYLKCLNAAEAARRAGYPEKTAAAIGSENLNKPYISEAINLALGNMHSSVSDKFSSFLRRKNNPSTFIYFIHSDNGLTKIGIAKDVKLRLTTLNIGSPVELSLLFYFESQNAKRAEANLHKRFSQKRVKGEWFNLSDKDISWIKENYDIIEEINQQPTLFCETEGYL